VRRDIGREVVEVFSLGHKKPREVIECSAQCWAIALSHRAKRLWVDEVNGLNGTIDEFSYQDAKFVETLAQTPNSYPLGLATTRDLY